MGTWGTGLYASDTARDLRSTVLSLLRLPLDADDLVAEVVAAEPALNDERSEDHAAGWFVLADQLHRHGVDHRPTIDRVLGLIEDGTDLRVSEQLGMSPADLRGRARLLEELAVRLATPHPSPHRRVTLQKPQKFIVDVGAVLSFPMMGHRSANPYFRDWASERPPFSPDRVGVAVVLDRGHTFGYLAWYTTTMLSETWSSPPSLAECLPVAIQLPRSGTLTATKSKRMAMQTIGAVEVLPAAAELLPAPGLTRAQAISDVSLCNALNISRHPLTGHRLSDVVRT